MLPASHRLRRSADFTTVMRGGQRAARATLVVHVLVVAPAATPPAATPPAPGPDQRYLPQPSPPPSRFGLVVGRSVGPSVVRHRVSRRLRALLSERIEHVAAGADVVVRARPEAATASSAELGADLDAALATVVRRLDRAQSGRSR